MSNSLNQNIPEGTIVEVDKDAYNDSLCLFVCKDGSGMHSFTHGAKIFGTWVSDGSKDHIRGEHLIRIVTPEEVQKHKVAQ